LAKQIEWLRQKGGNVMRNAPLSLVPVIIFTGILMLITFGLRIPVVSHLTETESDIAFAGGNGAPSGPHYNLNIIGVPKGKNPDMDGNQGHRIFVPLFGNAKIWLAEAPEGESFQVLDANGTDQNGAKFQLPDPFPNDDLVPIYTVYARALGRPGGYSHTILCYEDPGTGETICSGDTLTLRRGHGQQKFTNVTQKLLTIWIDTNGDGIPDSRVGLFDEDAYEYFWEYDNFGLKLAQLRFYPVGQ
jgi:hypothetical protein